MAHQDSKQVEVLVENGKTPENENSKESAEDFVDPWNVISKSATGIDYDKLICKSNSISDDISNIQCLIIFSKKYCSNDLRSLWKFQNRSKIVNRNRKNNPEARSSSFKKRNFFLPQVFGNDFNSVLGTGIDYLIRLLKNHTVCLIFLSQFSMIQWINKNIRNAIFAKSYVYFCHLIKVPLLLINLSPKDSDF